MDLWIFSNTKVEREMGVRGPKVCPRGVPQVCRRGSPEAVAKGVLKNVPGGCARGVH